MQSFQNRGIHHYSFKRSGKSIGIGHRYRMRNLASVHLFIYRNTQRAHYMVCNCVILEQVMVKCARERFKRGVFNFKDF